jgi:hypothetical protein
VEVEFKQIVLVGKSCTIIQIGKPIEIRTIFWFFAEMSSGVPEYLTFFVIFGDIHIDHPLLDFTDVFHDYLVHDRPVQGMRIENQSQNAFCSC